MTLSASQLERIAGLVDNAFAVKSIHDDAQKEKSNPLETAGDLSINGGRPRFYET